MMQLTTYIGRAACQCAILAVPLLVPTTGTAAAHGGGMIGSSWGLFGGAMGLWGLIWVGLLIGVPLYLVVALGRRGRGRADERPLTVLRERYACGELSDEEFNRRREQLERVD